MPAIEVAGAFAGPNTRRAAPAKQWPENEPGRAGQLVSPYRPATNSIQCGVSNETNPDASSPRRRSHLGWWEHRQGQLKIFKGGG